MSDKEFNTILKKAAEILVECGYADPYSEPWSQWAQGDKLLLTTSGNGWHKSDFTADTHEGRRQLDTIFWHLINGRESFELTGLGHLNHREQIIEFVKGELSK